MRQGDELLHIFMHHISKTEDNLREILRSFMLGHITWIHRISKIVLTVSVEDYIDTITSPGVALDFCCNSCFVLCVSHTSCCEHIKRIMVIKQRKNNSELSFQSSLQWRLQIYGSYQTRLS